MPYANLRDHRKILVVDGAVGFTGGMNLRVGHMLSQKPRHPVADCHFRVRGPVLAQLWDAFATDWQFTCGEILGGDAWQVTSAPCGSTPARGIAEGPDDRVDKLHWILLGALACARQSVAVVTPYFLPDQQLVAALNTTALRGVPVRILVPERNNLVLVKWACQGLLEQLLSAGCEVYAVSGDFDHSKLMVVDDVWCFIGSANWDARSLRLNFEFNIEAYDAALAQQLNAAVRHRLARSRRIRSAQLAERPLPIKLRDSLARLLSPYL